MQFFLAMNPPTVTAQMHKVTVRNGKPAFYDTVQLKQARAQFLAALKPEAPVEPMAGAVLLSVLWAFPTKSHRHNSYRTTRPDTDNLQKLLKDCMTAAGFWKDDAQVCVEVVTKRWTRETPGILIQVEKIHENC